MKIWSLTLTNEVFNAISLDQRINLIRLEKKAPTLLTFEEYKFLDEIAQLLKEKGIEDLHET